MERVDVDPDTDRLYAPLLLAAGSAVIAAGALQTAGRWLETFAKRSSPMAELVRESFSESDDRDVVRLELREQVLGLLREFGEIASQETRKSIEEFDSYTRTQFTNQDAEYSRSHRVKR